MARWIEYVFQFKFALQHRAGTKHSNADALSRLPDENDECRFYRLHTPLEELPCGGCGYCSRRHEEWKDFAENVDDVVPLTKIRQVKT